MKINLVFSRLRSAEVKLHPLGGPEVEAAIAICSRGMHGTHYKRIAKIELAAISAYLFKTDPAALEGCDRAPFKSNAVR